MSTKNIEAALKDYGRITGNAESALEELRAIQEATQTLVSLWAPLEERHKTKWRKTLEAIAKESES